MLHSFDFLTFQALGRMHLRNVVLRQTCQGESSSGVWGVLGAGLGEEQAGKGTLLTVISESS